jgi:hypothetical protein
MTSTAIDGGRTGVNHRRTLRCRAELQLDAGVTIEVRTIDISPSGMSLMSQLCVAAGVTCRVVFYLPADGQLHQVAADARVIYNTCRGTDGFRIGLRFTDKDPARIKLTASLQ